VVAEVGYLLGRAGGAKIEAAFLRSIAQETFTIVDLELVDYTRMAELVETYADFPLGTTDAAVVAVAERLGITEIATLDRRHFHAVRPRHTDASTCCPDSRSCWVSGELGRNAFVSDSPVRVSCLCGR
jgi:predicted nucleic acid-binding protein